MPVVGFLRNTLLDASANLVAALRQGLKESGYIEGQNLAIEYRWAENRFDRLPALAADLVRRQCAVIVTGGEAAALAAKAATATIPIVFATGNDPIEIGLVASLSRPGGNVTGIYFYSGALLAKQLQLMHELVPKAAVIGMLVNPTGAVAESQIRDAQEAARALGQQIHVVNASTEPEIDTAFATLAQHQVGVLVIQGNALFLGRRDQLVALAARHAVPTVYNEREYVAAGGLMSYGASITDAYRQVGVYTGRILKGAKPADLPVQQPTRFEFVLNLKVARELGLAIPQSILFRVDEAIE